MFAHPATAHLPRTYGGHPTTGRRKLAVHNENNLGGGGGPGGLPSKTPSRAGASGLGGVVGGGKQLAPGTAIRIGLGAKTEGRDRNVLARQTQGDGKDAKGKGSGKEEEIEPKRLFASSSGLPPSKSLSNLPTIEHRPFQSRVSKTPARQQQPPPTSRKAPSNKLRTPAPSTFKVAQDTSSTSTPLPSAARRRRSRSGPAGGTPLKSTTSKQADAFRTPLPSGQRWEEEQSLDSIEEIGPGEGIEMDVLGDVAEEADLELEYMPPKVQELPYEPDWGAGPDVEHLMKRLQGVPLILFDDSPALAAPTFEAEPAPSELIRLSDEELEDPVFRRPRLTASSNTKAGAYPAKSSAVAIGAAPSQNRSTAASHRGPPPSVRPSVQGRPGILRATTTVRPAPPPVSARPNPPISRRTAVPPISSSRSRLTTQAPLHARAAVEVIEEDEEMRLAREELGCQDLVFDLRL